jgi:hypothetical protein
MAAASRPCREPRREALRLGRIVQHLRICQSGAGVAWQCRPQYCSGAGNDCLGQCVLKEFPFSETKRIKLRTEFFNMMNHPNFTTCNLDLSDSNFGDPSNASTPRQIQFALKFAF